MCVIARHNSEQSEQHETTTIHVASTMITNDTSPIVMASADPGMKSTSNMLLSFTCRVEYKVS